MKEPEMKVIPQKQSLWLKIGGWLPVVVIMGIFTFVTTAIQSTFNNDGPGKVAVSVKTIEVVTWTSWVPLFVFMIFVFVAISVAWTKKDTLQAKQWWIEKKKDPIDVKWFWYMIVAIITISASYVAPNGYKIGVAFVVALVGLHIVWLFLITGKTSAGTKALVTGFFLFIIVAGLLPGTSTYLNSKWRVIKKDVADKSATEKKYADNYEKGIVAPVASSQQSAIAGTSPPQKSWWGPEITVNNVDFTEIPIPSGVTFSVYCVGDGVQRVWRDGSQDYTDQKCGKEIAGLPIHHLRLGVRQGNLGDDEGESQPSIVKEINVMVKYGA